MMRIYFLATLLLAALLASESFGQQPKNDSADQRPQPTGPSIDGESIADIDAGAKRPVDEALAQSPQAFVDAFNAHDAKAVAALWTPDGEYINEVGERYRGRDAIEKHYASFFQDHPQAVIAVTVDSLRQISETAAIEEGHATVAEGTASTSSGEYTTVSVKVGDAWLLSSVRDSSGQYSATTDHLADLRWLTGNWTATSNGTTMKVSYEWVADNKYLQRTYSVTRDDKVISSGIQIIGWSAESQFIQSWTFSSDGGFAIGIWLPSEGGWSIQSRGTLPDGTTTQALNVFTRIDNNAANWVSTERSVGTVQLQDLPEVLLKRDVSKK